MSERKGGDGDPQTLPHLKIGKRNSVGRRRLEDSVWESRARGQIEDESSESRLGIYSRRDFLIVKEIRDGLRTLISFVYFDMHYDKWRLY